MSREQRLHALGLLLFIGICFALAVHYFSLAGTNLIPGATPYRIQAVVPSAVSLAPKADVREGGVNVGKVTKIAGSGSQGVYTTLGIQLDSHAPVYRDAQVFVRAKSVAGENYVELDPGSSAAGALPDGGVLGLDHAQDPTQIDQIFSIFDRTRRTDVQRALSGLGTGLSGTGRSGSDATGGSGGQHLNQTLEAVSALPDQGSPAAAVLAHDRTQLAALVDQFGTVARALGDRADSIRLFTRQVRTAATAVAARDAQLRALLASLPPFLSQAQESAGRLQRFAVSATPVVGSLRAATQDLVPAIQVLAPAAQEGKIVMSRLRTFAQAALPALQALRPFSRALSGFTSPLQSFVRQVKPMVTYLAPYWREIAGFFSQDAGSFQQTDSLGHVARIVLPISRSNLSGLLTPAEERLLQKLESSFDSRGTNPYPVPGHAGAGSPMTGSYPQIQPDPPYSH
jgi:phospholipid/cholesterol/gamma-HCH transport system substrate-binding protein